MKSDRMDQPHPKVVNHPKPDIWPMKIIRYLVLDGTDNRPSPEDHPISFPTVPDLSGWSGTLVKIWIDQDR